MSVIATGGTAPIRTSRIMPPTTATTKDKKRTPNKSKRFCMPSSPPLRANTKVPTESSTCTRSCRKALCMPRLSTLRSSVTIKLQRQRPDKSRRRPQRASPQHPCAEWDRSPAQNSARGWLVVHPACQPPSPFHTLPDRCRRPPRTRQGHSRRCRTARNLHWQSQDRPRSHAPPRTDPQMRLPPCSCRLHRCASVENRLGPKIPEALERPTQPLRPLGCAGSLPAPSCALHP